jgi:hypothetical protein
MTGCIEPLVSHDPLTYHHCGQPGHVVRLPCSAGRPDAVGGPYCDEHGGEGRARQEASRDWNYLAPESVGSAAAVSLAGSLCLQTPNAYVVVRRTPDSQGGTWLAWLGLGSLLEPVENPLSAPHRRGGRKHLRAGQVRATTGTRSFPTREAALARATDVWRRRLAETVALITRERGGTLEWGVPVAPLAEPVVIVLEQGDSRSAWDLAVTLPRRCEPGIAWASGLRPSGEAA